MNAEERKLAEEGAARLADEMYRRTIALGRIQALSHARDELTGHLTLAIRGAFRAGASLDEMHVESGLPRRVVKAVVAGAALEDTARPMLGRRAA